MYIRVSFLVVVLLVGYNAMRFADEPKYPKLQDMAPQSYEAQVELVTKNEVTTAVDIYDFEKETGRLDVITGGTSKSFYYYNNPAQVVHIHNNTCSVTDINISQMKKEEIFFGWFNPVPLVFGPTALLRWPKNDLPTYIGAKIIRGISCSQFTYLSLDSKHNVTIDYFFSDGTWTTPFNKNTPVPVRVEVNGYILTEKEKTTDVHEVHYDMDFNYFRPTVNDYSKFQFPLGVGCYNRNAGGSQTLPPIPKQFNFFAATFDLKKESQTSELEIDRSRMWYDGSKKVARLDTYSSESVVSQLLDFRTGVVYRIVDGITCKTEPLRDFYFENFEEDSKLVGRMKQPEDVLGLVGDFYYMGEREMRGIKCNVFESAKPNYYYQISGKRYDMFVTTVFFASDKTKEAVEGRDTLNPPVFFLLTGYENSNKVTLKNQINIYAFSDVTGADIFQTFRLEQCFPLSEQKSYFVLEIPSNETTNKGLEDLNALFLEEAKDKIIEAAKITDIRLPFIKAEYLSTAIYITGLILDEPPALAQFWLEYRGLPKDTDVLEFYPGAGDEASCATACVEMAEDKCRRFHLCDTDCYLNVGQKSKTSKGISVSKVCTVYIRSASESKNIQDTLSKALKNLDTAVNKKELKIPVPLSKNKKDFVIPSSISITDGPINKETNDHQYKLVFNGYQIHSDSEKTKDIPDAYTENDCYRQCKENAYISCTSFSYCFKGTSKRCRLSSVFMDGRKDNYHNIDKHEDCNVYSMRYLEFYEQFPGKTVLEPGEKQFTKIATAEECAKSCREESSITCRGFEYCETQKTCVLHSKHILDLKPQETAEVAKAECVHYAAKYSADYVDLGRTVSDVSDDERNEITLEGCARACSEEESNCQSFTYCPPSDPETTDSTCSLSSVILGNSSITVSSEGQCRRYAKRDNIYDWVKREIPAASPQEKGYTSGGLAGVIMGCLILGVFIGVLIFVAYSYVRSRQGKGDGMALRFLKKENP